MGASTHNTAQGQGDGLRRLGAVAGGLMADLPGQRSARQRTTRKPRKGATPTAEELRAKASALLPSGNGSRATAAPSCPLCGGIGRVKVWIGPENWRTRDEPCTCQAATMAQARWGRALSASDMSPELRALDFAGYDARYNAAALAVVSDWTKGLLCAREGHLALPPWVLLYGGPGSGKTHLLAAAFNTLLDAGSYPLYTVVPALLDHIRDGLDEPNSREYGARFKAVREAPILMLDDLGAEKSSEWTDELLFKLLDYRYRQALPTAVASNLIPADLEPRIASRLQDRGLSTALLMAGPDYRLSGQRSSQRAARRSTSGSGKTSAKGATQ